MSEMPSPGEKLSFDAHAECTCESKTEERFIRCYFMKGTRPLDNDRRIHLSIIIYEELGEKGIIFVNKVCVPTSGAIGRKVGTTANPFISREVWI